MSTYDLFRASLASISVVKWIILQSAILKLVAIAVFSSYPKSPLSSVTFWTPWTSILLQFSETFLEPGGLRILITLFRLVSLPAKITVHVI